MHRKHWSTWYSGTEEAWRAMPLAERDTLSFAATGCLVAYPTWDAPVDCVHLKCQIARGERPLIALTNGILRGERESGYLRYTERGRMARIYRAARRVARVTGEYDPWKMPGGWQVMVAGGLNL